MARSGCGPGGSAPAAAAVLAVAWLDAASDLMIAWLKGAEDMMAWPEGAADLVVARLEAAVGSARGHCDWTWEGCASHIRTHLGTHCFSYFNLQIELALLSSDPYGVVFKPMLPLGFVYIYTEATSRGGNEHYDISMYFSPAF